MVGNKAIVLRHLCHHLLCILQAFETESEGRSRNEDVRVETLALF